MIALDLLDPRHPQHASIRGSKKVRMSSLFVYPEWRKGGYGAAAVRMVERLAREDYGAEVMTLDTHTVNGPIKYYEDMGYVVSGPGSDFVPRTAASSCLPVDGLDFGDRDHDRARGDSLS
jgi:hypothetical protein